MHWRRIAVLAALTSMTGLAQTEQSAVDIYGGYSLLRQAGNDPSGTKQIAHGWNADVTAHVWKRLSATAQFGGNYKNDSRNTTTYLFGPHIRLLEWKGVTVSARALAGVARSELYSFVRFSELEFPIFSWWNETSPAGAFGGTVDVRVTDRISWRAAQVDALLTDLFGRTRWEFRYSTGIVIKFGRK